MRFAEAASCEQATQGNKFTERVLGGRAIPLWLLGELMKWGLHAMRPSLMDIGLSPSPERLEHVVQGLRPPCLKEACYTCEHHDNLFAGRFVVRSRGLRTCSIC
jgi:hypothetical protein